MNNLEKAQWLSDRWAEVAQGGVWEYQAGSWLLSPSGPTAWATFELWRVVMPPVLKVIDLTPLIESGLDCEFWNDKAEKFIGKLLNNGSEDGHASDVAEEFFDHCQPRMAPYVHYWGGGDACPVPEGFVIQVEWYDTLMHGFNENGFPNYSVFNWAEIVAFRILRVADGYTLGGGE